LYCCIVLAQLCNVLRFDKAVESGDVRFRESNYFLFNSLCKSIFYLTESVCREYSEQSAMHDNNICRS